MRRKLAFVFAGIFLAVALIAPPIILIMQSDSDLDNYITSTQNQGLVTSGNATILDEINENNQTTFLLVAAIESIFVALFAISIWFGINQ
jgi:hypothetical protein